MEALVQEVNPSYGATFSTYKHPFERNIVIDTEHFSYVPRSLFLR
ncbi:hypothetical protein SAMN04487944_102210 [Gracilibacillus ureilyticus]|uniref:Uncharacterized protein n=1 Tax=Gracilibacillus ureilyticus TaxID=531814 RepID=A0A1H9MX78_9BACI|nr:hypothetical protein [Gracilibacillus ureilyticus]SER28181.1 hypothetical protein SAMN04487944_102210 [Gracilibacillus ureilyticus]